MSFGRSSTANQGSLQTTIASSIARRMNTVGIASPDSSTSGFRVFDANVETPNKRMKKALSLVLLANPSAAYSPCSQFLDKLKHLRAERIVTYERCDTLKDVEPAVRDVYPELEHVGLKFSVKSTSGGKGDHRPLRQLDDDTNPDGLQRSTVYVQPTAIIAHEYDTYPLETHCFLCIKGLLSMDWLTPSVEDSSTSLAIPEPAPVSIPFAHGPVTFSFDLNKEAFETVLELIPEDPVQAAKAVSEYLLTEPPATLIVPREVKTEEYLALFLLDETMVYGKVSLRQNFYVEYAGESIVRASNFSIAEGHNYMTMRLQSEELVPGYSPFQGQDGRLTVTEVPGGKWGVFQRAILAILKSFLMGGDGFLGLHPFVVKFLLQENLEDDWEMEAIDGTGDLAVLDLWKKTFEGEGNLASLVDEFELLCGARHEFSTLQSLRTALLQYAYVDPSKRTMDHFKSILDQFGIRQLMTSKPHLKETLFCERGTISAAMLRDTLVVPEYDTIYGRDIVRRLLTRVRGSDALSRIYFYLTGSFAPGRKVTMETNSAHERLQNYPCYMSLCDRTLFINRAKSAEAVVECMELQAIAVGNDEGV